MGMQAKKEPHNTNYAVIEYFNLKNQDGERKERSNQDNNSAQICQSKSTFHMLNSL